MALSHSSAVVHSPPQELPDAEPKLPVSSVGFDLDPWEFLIHLSGVNIFPSWEKTGDWIRHWILLWQDQWKRQLWIFTVPR